MRDREGTKAQLPPHGETPSEKEAQRYESLHWGPHLPYRSASGLHLSYL